MTENHHIAVKGIAGAGFNLLAVITSAQEQFEFWFRIASLSVGIAVGVLTLVSLVRNLKKRP